MYRTENRAGPSNIGNVISQILLCKQIQPDFNQEEICSIAKDSQDLARLIQDMQEFLPQQDTAAGMYIMRHNYMYIMQDMFVYNKNHYIFIIIFLCVLFKR